MSPGEAEGADRGPLFDHRYRVVGKLGEGGMAEVFHVLDEARGGQPMAYKLLKGQREHLEHFQREFEVLSRLNHPNLIQVFDFGLTDSGRSVFYTAEYVKGRDLFKATLDLDHDHLFDLVVQIARGLTYIHARGLIHYDIKPENIVVRDTSDGWPASGTTPAPDLVKIMDFGLTGEERSPGEARIKGTVHYLAPEIARGVAHDRRVDLYSLGISLYHCLARKLPFDGNSTFSVIRKHLETVPEPLRALNSTVPFAWEEFSLRLMAKDPGERPASASDALMDLAARLGRHPELDTKETLEGYLLSARFVGREAEMGLIRGLIEERSSDLVGQRHASEDPGDHSGSAGAVVLVAGEGGIGKTRLLDESRIFAQLRGVPFLMTECTAGGPPLATFSRIVHAVAAMAGSRSRPASSGSRGRSRLDRLLAEEPALAALLGIEAGWRDAAATDSDNTDAALSVASQSQMERDLALDRLAGALVEIATEQPFVVAIEDLHFADAATLRMVAALVRNLEFRDEANERSGAGLVMLLSYRPELVESGSPLEGVMGLVADSDVGREIVLAGIDESSVAALVGSMLAMTEVTPDLVSEIRDRAGGNPQFVCELLRALIEDDAVRIREGPTPRLGESLAALGTPRSLADVVQKRLDRLDGSEDRVTLEVLAVSFPALPADTLSEATGLESENLLEVIERLQRSGLVVEGSPTTKERNASAHYTPAHRTLRDGILAGLDEKRKTDLHRVVGMAVESLARRRARPGTRYPVTPELLLDLSRHFELCGEGSRCFVYSVAAADHAIRLYANEVAIDCLQRALTAAGRWPDAPVRLVHSDRREGVFGDSPLDSSSDERPSLLEEAGMSSHRRWQRQGSQSGSRSRSGSKSGRQAASAQGGATLRQREPACRLRLGELLARVGRAVDAEQILGPLLQLGDQRAARMSGRGSSGSGQGAKEQPGAEPPGGGAERGVSMEFLAPRALRVLGSVRLRVGRLQAALEAFDAALDACGPRARRGSALGKPSATKRSQRRSRGDDDLDRERVRSLAAIARVHLWRGDYARAVSVAEEARSFLGGSADMRESLRVIGVLAVAEYHRGRYGMVARLLRDCIDALRADERQARRFLRRLALPSVSEESFTEALLYLEARPRLCRTVSDSYGVTVSFSELGFLFDLRGSPDDAVLHYERSRRIYERLGDTQGVALALNNLGVLSRIRGEYGNALEMLSGAQALQRRVEDRQGEAATLLNLGLVRLVVGDMDRAEEELSGALDRTRALGLRWMAGFAQKALARLEAQLGRLDRCMDLLRRSEGLFRQIGNPRALGDVLLDHAERLIEMGRQDDSLEMIERARNTGEEEKGPDFLATAELLGGRIALERGQVREAMVQLDSAHSYVQETGLVELEVKVEAMAGEVYEAAGRLRLAASHYDRAATLERRIWEGLPANLGESFFRSPERERLRRAKRRVGERLLEDDL